MMQLLCIVWQKEQDMKQCQKITTDINNLYPSHDAHQRHRTHYNSARPRSDLSYPQLCSNPPTLML